MIIIQQKLYRVFFKCLACEDVALMDVLVDAKNKTQAKAKHRKLAKQRRNYPYCWTDATLVEEVTGTDIIR